MLDMIQSDLLLANVILISESLSLSLSRWFPISSLWDSVVLETILLGSMSYVLLIPNITSPHFLLGFFSFRRKKAQSHCERKRESEHRIGLLLKFILHECWAWTLVFRSLVQRQNPLDTLLSLSSFSFYVNYFPWKFFSRGKKTKFMQRLCSEIE